MAGFDLASLLPCYLDETDEQVAGLGAALLRLEKSPTDDGSLREAFRLIHTIKGASMVLGFVPVKDLTHHLEAYFEGLRSGHRTLDRTALNLCFRCLDALRDYHNDLRAGVETAVDLASLTALVQAIPDQPPSPEPEPAKPIPPAEVAGPPGSICLTLHFEANLPWPDMKATLVLNRLAAKGRILATDPPAERLEEIESLHQFRIWIESDCEVAALLALANVDGVAEVKAESIASPQAEPEPVEPDPIALEMPISPIRDEAPTIQSMPPQPAPSEARKKVAETVRVDVDRLDQLMNLAGELVISKSRFFEIARGLDDLFRDSNAHGLAADAIDRLDAIARGLEGRDGGEPSANGSLGRWAAQTRRLRENFRAIASELDLIRQGRERLGAMAEAIDHLSRISDGIQRGVLETRMVPIGPLFDRFHRVIRDLKQSSNKEIVLKTSGEKTELDKRMIDELNDPLVHLIRNAVDHGLEPPDAREAAGKARIGTVTLAASHRGNSVVVTVADDGRGIDREKVRRKAVANGLIGEEDSRRLDDRQIVQFIFHPGLSTAEAVTDISGRGVGMDIVKSRIEALNGTIEARPEPGQGTTFTIRLPLTLAILPVLLARVDGEIYAIPIDHLDEIVEVVEAEIDRIHGRRSFAIRGRITSLISFADIFGRDELNSSDGHEILGDAKSTVVVVSNGEHTVGLVVDELLGMQEAVLKSLARNFRPVEGLSGASILGDGRVCLILDVDALIHMAARKGRTLAHATSP